MIFFYRYDEERFKRGQSFANHHYTAYVFVFICNKKTNFFKNFRLFNGSVVGLLVFLQLPIGLTLLLATGKSRNLSNLFRRYFDTSAYVNEW